MSSKSRSIALALGGGALLALALAARPMAVGAPDLAQGWTADDRKVWYEATQGSRLLPLEWLQALEQPASTAMFLDDAYIASFRYLPRVNSDGLRMPLGFVLDDTPEAMAPTTGFHWKQGQGDRAPWVGMTCSACHTAELTYRGQTLRVDGGPTLADFQGFMTALDASLAATHADRAKFKRFAARIPGVDANDPQALSLLDSALTQLIAKQTEWANINRTPLRYGYGRLDAFGHIYNKVAVSVGAPSPRRNPSDAPVSYPFLWNVPQMDFVQWNGIAPNKPFKPPVGGPVQVGALGRNTGEVIGVFADLQTAPGAPFAGYVSSVNVRNLTDLERRLSTLRPPRWPSELFDAAPPPGPQTPVGSAVRGRALFTGDTAHCSQCHQTLQGQDDLTTEIPRVMGLFAGGNGLPPPGTDVWMACNAFVKTASSGNLKGTPKLYYLGDPLPDDAFLSDMLGASVAGSLAGEKGEVIKASAASFFGIDRPAIIVKPPQNLFDFAATLVPRSEKQQRLDACNAAIAAGKSPILGYKARPLTGIWATAPYLHNGSVPTLYDLLLPAAQRPKVFYLGSREFDPVRVGYVTARSPDNSFRFDTALAGNSNAGHDYGNARLSDQDRADLIAYLKTL